MAYNDLSSVERVKFSTAHLVTSAHYNIYPIRLCSLKRSLNYNLNKSNTDYMVIRVSVKSHRMSFKIDRLQAMAAAVKLSYQLSISYN